MDIKEIIENEQNIIDRAPCSIAVGAKVYKVKQISNTVRRRISILTKEAYLLE